MISVADTKFTDAAGNTNADGSEGNNTSTITVDTVLPTIALSSRCCESEGRGNSHHYLYHSRSRPVTLLLEILRSLEGLLVPLLQGPAQATQSYLPLTASSTADGVISVGRY